MSLGLYVHGTSPLHRAPPGAKILALAGLGTALFLTADLPILGAALAGVAGLWHLSGVPWRQAAIQLRPLLWPVLLIFVAQALLDHWTTGVAFVLRVLALVGLAALVSLTTQVSAMIATLEKALQPLAVVGIRPARASLAVSLAIRFIPVLVEILAEVREAQASRGLERSVRALAVPLIVRTLRAADEIADAIDARAFDTTPDAASSTGAKPFGANSRKAEGEKERA